MRNLLQVSILLYLACSVPFKCLVSPGRKVSNLYGFLLVYIRAIRGVQRVG